MNIAQALAIAIATYAYALFVEEPWSARFAIAHAEACTLVAEAEALGDRALAESEALLIAALQQRAPLELTL